MVDNMSGFNNGIMMAYGMCPPVTTLAYYQMEQGEHPSHFMRGTAEEIWGDDPHNVMLTMVEEWDETYDVWTHLILLLYSYWLAIQHGVEN